MTINDLTRRIVRRRAQDKCEYCHSPERISSARFTIDHIQPRSLGGSDQPENLALACSRCNQRRYNFIVGRVWNLLRSCPCLILDFMIGQITLSGLAMEPESLG